MCIVMKCNKYCKYNLAVFPNLSASFHSFLQLRMRISGTPHQPL